MIKYVFRDGPLIIKQASKANPQKIGEAIARARARTAAGGDVRKVLEDDARNRRHPMHRHLEWDDAVAAQQHRLAQIGDLIRVIAVENEDTGRPEPAFISLTPHRGRRGFWTPEEIRSSGELQTAALLAAERDLEAFERRHRALTDICENVRAVREQVRARREATESRAAA